jgi:dUTPase
MNQTVTELASSAIHVDKYTDAVPIPEIMGFLLNSSEKLFVVTPAKRIDQVIFTIFILFE